MTEQPSFREEFLRDVARQLGLSYEQLSAPYHVIPASVEREPDDGETRIICGGLMGGRALHPDDYFEMAVNAALGDAIRESDVQGSEVWAAITGVTWVGPDGVRWQYSYRAAGDIVAACQGDGDYLRWYCSAPVCHASVPAWIATAMLAQGWTWEVDAS